MALCHQVTTLDRSKLSTPIGTLTPWLLQDVSAGLAAAMDLQMRR
jgi:mRNA-degrading endonuclease toxin of MazEF toxin-antitoxin module